MKLLRRIAHRLSSRNRSLTSVAPLSDHELNPWLHPLEAHSGHGGRLVDTHDRDWLDLHSAWGTNLLGYRHPAIVEVIVEQAGDFLNLGVPHPGYRELARLLQQTIPCADAVRFGKNGSDATLGAVRLARAVTGRELVLHCGYHGFHDWWMASIECPGVPSALRELIVTLPHLTPHAVLDAFALHAGRIACLILDPMLCPDIEASALREIAATVHRDGALLIFDEVVSGFRVAPGGMQQVWGVTPDLACFGKSLANGLPLSALAGRRDLIRRLPAVHYGMTFEGEALSIAAARATLRIVLEQNVCAELASKGRRLKQAYSQLAVHQQVKTEIMGHDARPHFVFSDQHGIPERHLRWLFLQELARRRVLTIGTLNFCFSHSTQELAELESACEGALICVRQALELGSVRRLMRPELFASLVAAEHVERQGNQGADAC